MEKYFKIAHILAKSLVGSLTAEEQQLLREWRNASTRNEQLYADLNNPKASEKSLEQFRRFKDHQKQLHMSWQKGKMVHQPFSFRPVAVAAAVLAVALLSGVLFFNQSNLSEQVVEQSTISVQPGKAGAILTLASGQQVLLDDQMSDSIHLSDELQQTVVISRKQLSYLQAAKPKQLNKAQSELVLAYNTLEVPVKAEFSLVLEDGTRVTLNAGSKLKYPVQFGSESREVYVSGEAFFEVAHDEARPFWVIDQFGNRIEDVGTNFNVKVYPDEAMHEVALVEGEINFHTASKLQQNLQPGYAIQYPLNSSDLKVKAFDVDEVVSWKEGRFIFNDREIQQIFKSLSRWYGIRYEFDREATSQLRFTVDIPKYENLSTIIEILESTGSIHFSQVGELLRIESVGADIR